MNKILIDYDWVKLLLKGNEKLCIYPHYTVWCNMHISVQRKLSISFDYVTEI